MKGALQASGTGVDRVRLRTVDKGRRSPLAPLRPEAEPVDLSRKNAPPSGQTDGSVPGSGVVGGAEIHSLL